nr:hypothetical protein [Tanacetum cinerariifolium]
MVAIIKKSDAAKGFEQIINFLSGSYIHYALTVNPHIYVSCIKQFWSTASVKRSDDVTRLQALVDRKQIVILKDVIRKILQLDDAEGAAFFSSQWKFLILTLLQSLSAKRTSWNEFSTVMASANQIGDLSTHTTRFISPDLTQKVFANMRRVGKGFPRVETPLFKGMLAARQLTEEGIGEERVQADDAVQETVAEDKLEMIKLKARVKRLEMDNKVKSSKLKRLKKVETSKRIESSDDMEDVFNKGRIIDDLDKDGGIELVVDQVKDVDIAKTEGRHAAEQAEKQAEIYHLDLDHPSKVLSMQEDNSKVQEVVEVITTAKLITEVVTAATFQVSAASATIFAAKPSISAAAPTVVAAYTRRRKGVIIRDPEEELSSKTPAETPKLKDKGKEINKDHEEINKDIDWDGAIDHVKQKSKNPHYIKRYQVMKKRPQTESEARKNMMIYLKNTAGYKLDFFKRMSYDEICPIFQAMFDANMRFMFKSREEMEEEDQE